MKTPLVHSKFYWRTKYLLEYHKKKDELLKYLNAEDIAALGPYSEKARKRYKLNNFLEVFGSACWAIVIGLSLIASFQFAERNLHSGFDGAFNLSALVVLSLIVIQFGIVILWNLRKQSKEGNISKLSREEMLKLYARLQVEDEDLEKKFKYLDSL